MDIVNQWGFTNGINHDKYVGAPVDYRYPQSQVCKQNLALCQDERNEGWVKNNQLSCDTWQEGSWSQHNSYNNISGRCARSGQIVSNSPGFIDSNISNLIGVDRVERFQETQDVADNSNIFIMGNSIQEQPDADLKHEDIPRTAYWESYTNASVPMYNMGLPYSTESYPLLQEAQEVIPDLSTQHQLGNIVPLHSLDQVKYLMRQDESPSSQLQVQDETRKNTVKTNCKSPSSSSDPKSPYNTQSTSELGKKLYPCKLCGKVFNRSYNQQQHVLIVHATVRKKGFKCTHEGCSKSYYRSADLQRHKRTHLQNSPKFSCLSCGKTFHRSDQMQRHLSCCKILLPMMSLDQNSQELDYNDPELFQDHIKPPISLGSAPSLIKWST